MIDEFRENALLNFDNYEDFLKFYKSLGVYDIWRISSGTMNSRGEYIRNRNYYCILQELFTKKEMYHKKVSIAEIVSWLDSFLVLRRLFDKLQLEISIDTFVDIHIYSEYVIKMSKKMRIDYIFFYNKTILLVELRMVSNFDKIRPTWEKKKMELLIYKELLENYISKDFKIITFALITLPEYEMRNKIDKHVNYNENQINFLMKYIKDFLIGQ